MRLWYIGKKMYIYNIKMRQMNQPVNNKKSVYHSKLPKGSITKDFKDYNFSPAAIRKTEEAIKFLEKAGFPEELLKIRDAQWGKK
jgi:hypothetical protein